MASSSRTRTGTAREPLSRNVKIVSLVSFCQDTASDMLYPVLPFFVTQVLGAPPAILGLVEGLADGTASVVKVWSGRLADVRRRRPLVAAGYGAAATGKLLLALATAWPLVLAARVTDRAGKGLRGPPRDAIIADETTPATRGRAFGFHRTADSAGAVVGPLAGLGLYHLVGEQLRPLLLVALVPAAISTALVFAVREKPHARVGEAHRKLREVKLPTRYWRFLVLAGAFSLVNFPDAMLLLRAADLGFDFTAVVVVYVLYNLSYTALSYPAGALSDRLGRRVVFTAGLVVFACTYAGFGLATGSAWIWILLPAYGAYSALTHGVGRAWVADLAPRESRGTALGIHAAVTGGGLVVAGVWAGLAWGDTGRVPFLVSGIATAALAAAFALGGRWIDPRAAQVGDG